VIQERSFPTNASHSLVPKCRLQKSRSTLPDLEWHRIEGPSIDIAVLQDEGDFHQQLNPGGGPVAKSAAQVEYAPAATGVHG
jgi:hypothetical protein